MAPDMAEDIRVTQIIQGYSLSEALGLGVYGGFAHSVVMGLVSSETAFVGAAAALSRLHRLAMWPDGEVALVRPAREDATREGIGRMLLRAAYTAAYGQFGWKAEAAPKRSAAQMRSCPDAGRPLRLDGATATLAECVCLAEAVIGAKRRDILLQFLIESVVLSGMGGLLGLVLGYGLMHMLENYLGMSVAASAGVASSRLIASSRAGKRLLMIAPF